jgi:uncharacterized protein involved in type VI secretion and phage assembly
MISDFRPDGEAPRYFGVYPAIVTNIVDEQSLGRIEVGFPWLGLEGTSVRAWATLLTPYADNDQGLEVLPEPDSQVVVAFEAGELRRPYIVGAAWNGVEALPAAAAEENNLRLFKSRAKSRLEFDDTANAAKVTLSMQSGHRVVLDDAAGTITITHSDNFHITFESSGAITIKANAAVEVHATQLNVHAPDATFDGIVNCMTLNAKTSVTSPSYTLGAGNTW